MSTYINSIPRPPKSLLDHEQKMLLEITGQRRDGFRDHVIYSLALGTGLREFEIVALNVGDVFNNPGKPKRRVQLRVFKSSNPDVTMQEVLLPDSARLKLKKFYAWKKSHAQSLDADAPLFVSRNGNRLSTRQLRCSFALWQERAGFERRLTFHSMRHSACRNVQRLYGDLRITQRFARHKTPISTAIYTEPSDEEMLQATRLLPC